MVNGQSKEVPAIIVPPKIDAKQVLTCHRFFAPVVIPQQDPLDPRKVNVLPRLGNFDCLGSKCTIWNAQAEECRDVTDSKSRAIIAEYAFNKMNDVHIQSGGAG